MRIAMMGTRGVPAHYGGFETCVEEVGARLAHAGHDVTVYCRGTSGVRAPVHRGMSLVHLPALRRRSLETLSHTFASVLHLLRGPRPDCVLLFNGANAVFLPLLRRGGLPVATHVDGLEWQRAKWSGLGQRYYRVAEALSVRWSDALIADARGIAEYYRDEFGAPTRLISYGAPRVDPARVERLAELGLAAKGYHLVVARFEPENHVDRMVEGYVSSGATLPLVVVGSTPYTEDYTRRVRDLADDRVLLLGGVWDQQLLDQLYAGALSHLHGHSVGGTNPSLLRALGSSTATIAFDVVFNREVLGEAGVYFRTAEDVAMAVKTAEADPEAEVRRGRRAGERAALYDWDAVAAAYERLCTDLVAGAGGAPRPSGRRRPATARPAAVQPTDLREEESTIDLGAGAAVRVDVRRDERVSSP